MLPGQTQIPHKPGRKTDAEEAYIAEFGREAFERQKQLALEADECTCSPQPEKPERRGSSIHQPGCPRVARVSPIPKALR